ncbi:SIR2 family protein [Flavobacterium sp. KBS0721]|uniref:SIR2 family protein n=1 Tax=Flavobacterium sp. KBS0721 TaxID=1179672 RepID=UPI00098EF538|nr:SIR2 family protein [Flavobacterium sp. KBS0721]QDW20478.1 SIR2 family protein [Flavobacterium sp. KBS0721]
MEIQEFISQYRNHPILFIGTGISLRYLKNSYTWDGLLSKIALELTGNPEYYLDVKSHCHTNSTFDYLKIANIIEEKFNSTLQEDRNGKFKHINDVFYEKMKNSISISRFKIYIAELFSKIEFRDEMLEELKDLKKIRKNIGSVITTNYDGLIENIFEFTKLIGNNILLSNPYGSVYKIHGCFENPEKIIITNNDYEAFDNKFELIRAQLLSLFIHNPIVFLGYSVGDENIKKILKTIFSYVEPNSELATKIKNNFLLVEYGKDIDDLTISEHDIVLEGDLTIRINKIKTDDFSSIYNSISDLQLPVSALDIRKVQNIVKEMYAGGDIKVSITEDLDTLKNGEKILAIGSQKTISYHFETGAELLSNYFNVIDESNIQILNLIDKFKIQATQYFPVFGFHKINSGFETADKLKKQQVNNINLCMKNMPVSCKVKHGSIDGIMEDEHIPPSSKMNALMWSTFQDNINLDEIEQFLREKMSTTSTDYRKLLSVYDLKKYNN